MKSPYSEAEWEALLKDSAPAWWIRIETHRLCELLTTHIALALETGTDPACVIALLARVRAATLGGISRGRAA